MPLDDGKKALLQELRIERGQREEYTDNGRSLKPWIIGGVVVVVLAVGGAAAWYYLKNGQKVEIEEVTAIAPASDPGATAILQATGYVTARRAATVSTQIIGTLKDVLIEEGEGVKEGQVLAHLDDSQYRAQVAQAEAQVNLAQATLGQFKAQLAQAKRDLVRDQDLVGQKLIPVQALETQQTQVETLEAQVLAQERQVELAQAGLKNAHVYLDYTIVRAPFTGVITAKAAQPGEIVSPSSAGGGFTRTGVGTIVDMDSLEIEVDVNEAYISRVTPNQPAKATLDAYPDWNIPAHVIAIIPTADRSKATVKVRVGIDQKDPRILPDMGVRVSFESAKSANEPPPKGVLVPASSIVTRDGKSVVFEVDGDRAREHTVNPGQSFGDLKLVQEINAGVHLVRTPPEELKDGTHVAIKQQE